MLYAKNSVHPIVEATKAHPWPERRLLAYFS